LLSEAEGDATLAGVARQRRSDA
jgi:hypothetical protein